MNQSDDCLVAGWLAKEHADAREQGLRESDDGIALHAAENGMGIADFVQDIHVGSLNRFLRAFDRLKETDYDVYTAVVAKLNLQRLENDLERLDAEIDRQAD